MFLPSDFFAICLLLPYSPPFCPFFYLSVFFFFYLCDSGKVTQPLSTWLCKSKDNNGNLHQRNSVRINWVITCRILKQQLEYHACSFLHFPPSGLEFVHYFYFFSDFSLGIPHGYLTKSKTITNPFKPVQEP